MKDVDVRRQGRHLAGKIIHPEVVRKFQIPEQSLFVIRRPRPCQRLAVVGLPEIAAGEEFSDYENRKQHGQRPPRTPAVKQIQEQSHND